MVADIDPDCQIVDCSICDIATAVHNRIVKRICNANKRVEAARARSETRKRKTESAFIHIYPDELKSNLKLER